MTSQVVLIANNSDMLDERRVVVESLHTIEFTKYVDLGSRLMGVFKLINKDFNALEERYDIPKGIIANDMDTINMMAVRQRFASGGEMLLIHLNEGVHEKMSFEEYTAYFNSMPPAKLKEVIKAAKMW